MKLPTAESARKSDAHVAKQMLVDVPRLSNEAIMYFIIWSQVFASLLAVFDYFKQPDRSLSENPFYLGPLDR